MGFAHCREPFTRDVRRHVNASSDPRLIRCLDGLDMSFAMLEHIYAELHATCARIRTDKHQLAPAFWRCWSSIDTVHRVREVSVSVPGLGAKTPQLKMFLSATSIAEGFRHYIQHLRKEISKSPGNTFPVWGSLSWVDPDDASLTHMVMAGAQVGETSYVGCVFDTVRRCWVSNVALNVNQLSFNFDPIFDECMKFREFVIPWLLEKYSPGVQVREELPISSVRLQFVARDA